MGNNNTKGDVRDEVYLNGLSRGMDSLRKSVDSYPDGTKKFKAVLDSHEKNVQEVLRRSRKGSIRKRALDLMQDLEDLKEKERASIRDSSLDNGAVESNSIIAADAKRYDKSRQHSRSIEDLQNIRKKVDYIGIKISGAGSKASAESSLAEIEVLKIQLDRLQLRPNSKLEAYKDEYKNKLRRFEEMLESKDRKSSTTDGVAMSKMHKMQQQHQKQQSREHRGSRDTQSHLNAQDELAMIRGQVMSLQSECEKFAGYKDTPEYNSLSQNLMKLWDKLGKIKDPKLAAERDDVIALISTTLKQLNRKCVENTRGSLSNNKILSLAELFHMQYKKIAIQIKQDKIKKSKEVYRILSDVRDGLESILGQTPQDENQNECHLVTARLTPSAKRRPISIYVSSQQLMETNYDTVYVQDNDQERLLKSNKSCPNFTQLQDEHEQVHVHATYVPNVENVVLENDPTEQFLGTLNQESIMLKVAVEEFDGKDLNKYNDLDDRLIQLIIQIGSLKDKLNQKQEQLSQAIKQRVQASCKTLKQKMQVGSLPHQDHVRNSREEQYLQDIDTILAHLEILKTQINESYEWQTDNPEFKVLDDALKSALMRLDLIEPGGDQRVQIARDEAISEVRQAIKRFNERRYIENRYAGTEV